MKKLFVSSFVLFLTLCVSYAATTYKLNNLFNFGSTANPARFDGSIQPGDQIGVNPATGQPVYITSIPATQPSLTNTYNTSPTNEWQYDFRTTGSCTNGFNNRGITYDPMSGNVLFVDTHEGSGGSQTNFPWTAIYVMDGDTAAIKNVLNIDTNVVHGGSYTLVVPGVAADGVVYVCNQTTASANNAFKIYRWDTADTNNPNFGQPPVVAYSGYISNNIGTSGERIGQTMDVRGSGPSTQIIIGTASANGTGTNIFIFTTPDGTNFFPTRISFGTNITTPVFNDGIAFGPGDTFFAKQVGQALYFMAWDNSLLAMTNGFGTNAAGVNPFSGVNQITGTIISKYAAVSVNDPLRNISGLAYDPTRKLLGGLEEIGGIATGGRGKVWLFDEGDPTNSPPAVIDSRIYTPNFQKTTAPMGYICFRHGTNIYAQASNNGFLCSSVDTVTLSAPTFTQDLPSSTRVATTANIHLEVFAVVDVTGYQWYSNNVAIPGATTYYYDLTNATTNMTGEQFKVVATNAAGSTTSTITTINVVDPAQFFHPTALWSVAANTLALNNATNFITSNGGSGSPNERCMAYNALSNQLLVVRGPSAFGSLKIMVIDADRGTNGYLYTLKTNGMAASSTLQLCGIGVADDGAVYAASVDGANNNGNDQSFKVFRWADTGSNTLPVQIFGTNCPASNYVAFPYNPISDLNGSATYRFGDALAVRGSGTSTEIIVDSQQLTTYAGILTPADGTMTNWTQSGFVLQNRLGSYGSSAYGNAIGRSIQFGSGNTFYQKRFNNNAAGSPLALMSYNPGGGLALLQTANTSPVLLTNGATAVNTTLKLAAGINLLAANGGTAVTTDSQLDLYDLTDPGQAVLLYSSPLPGGNAGNHQPNVNFVAQVIFGVNQSTGTNYVFVLEANNGVTAFTLSGGVVPAPQFASQPSNLRLIEGSSGSMQALADQLVTQRWYKGTNPPVDTGVSTPTFSITNASTANAGDYFNVISNQFGMATSVVAHVSIGLTNDNYTLFQRWVAAPGGTNYVTSNGGPNTPNERAFAYNSASNQIIVVSCPPASTTYHLYVVNADTGAFLYEMNTNGVVHEGASEVSGSNPIDLVGAAGADDGSIYVCNETPNGSGGSGGDPTKKWQLYRWTNSAPATPPVSVFLGDPASLDVTVNERWGDTMCVRGTGTNTEIFVNSQSGTYGAVLKPVDASLNVFTNYWFFDSGGGGGIGRSVQFATGSQVYEKRKSNPLVLSSYDTNLNTSLGLSQSPSSATLGGVFVDAAHNLAVGVDFVGSPGATPDAVSIYNISDPNTPMFVKKYSFGINQVANANAICETIVSGNHGWALDANNGLIGFTIVPPINTVNYSITSVTNNAGNVTLTWSSTAGFKYQVKSSTDVTLPITSWSNVGSVVNASDPGTNTSTTVAAPGAGTYYRVQIVP